MSTYLDTRDLNERLEELEAFKQALAYAREDFDNLNADASDDEREKAEDAISMTQFDFGPDEEAELKELEDPRDEVGSEWRHGETLIPESEFTDYCRELLEDCGDIPRNFPCYIMIDWDATANNLRADYSEAEFQGTTYLFRAS